MNDAMQQFLRDAPKAELHLHIEGTLEPELMLRLAKHHGVRLPWTSLEAVHRAYAFEDLQSFLDLYYLGASVLREPEDFHALASAYLARCRAQNIVHLEMMFDPQTHTDRGVPFASVMEGLVKAADEARSGWGMSVQFIMCFLRHLDEASALATLEAAKPWREHIHAVGLDSGERGNPPERFADAFRLAREQGYALTAHAGEEGPPAYITGALDVLGVERIDHGVRCLDDEALVARLVAEQVPLTVCPQSNVRLRVVDTMADHPILRMLERGLRVTVNSDDPAYFGGHLVDNYQSLATDTGMTPDEAAALIRNGFEAAWMPGDRRSTLLAQLDELIATQVAGDAAGNRAR